MSEADEQASRALVQGALLGGVMAMIQQGGPLMIVDVHQDHDEHSAYLPYFDVYLASGNHVRVAVSTFREIASSVTDLVFAREARAANIREQLRADMTRTVSITGLIADEDSENFVESLVDDAMHHCERLLMED